MTGGATGPAAVASPLWFARHELRFAWRDFHGMLTAGRRHRARTVLVAVLALGLFLHALAWSIAGPYAGAAFPPDKPTLVAVAGGAFLSWTLMLSQAMESVTRAFYARADLDLILSSPAPARAVFAVRIGAVALGTAAMAMLLVGPFVNVLAVLGGVRWLAAYGVLVAMALAATGIAVAATTALFAAVGPRRTRLLAQIVAAVVGAAFVIGVQAVSIFSFGSLSRFEGLRSDWMLRHAPGLDSPLWWPARAAMGEAATLAVVLAGALALLLAAVAAASGRFARYAVDAAGVAQGAQRRGRAGRMRPAAPARALRRKEWTLLARDPWLVSQTLMQILYLVPPALLLWHNFGAQTGAAVMVAPVLVMAAGQLAGGLAWLAVSGEDAPDLVATAPVPARAVLRAKTEAVLIAVALALAPLVAALACLSAGAAAVTALGILAAAGSATAIQLFFRAQARRSQFRRRQTSSRAATFAEAFASIGWAGAAGLAAVGDVRALVPAVLALAVVLVARQISPKAA
ncbi:permease [Labrys wisconsinensis]|uniref:ABC-2 type transport system permease protein n=1 Tax=Labrys wisconsinensis TaxID=425677 RepID=A0ABU0J233_9HYPH|nr:permease [Labrys wisconsinensis]MDQ0467282.1 ABC-2 type transport system permease protein [Labrys wisconsinensis]